MDIKLTHVASSTEGWWVMADDFTGTDADMIAGPFATRENADRISYERNCTAQIGALAGSCDSWSDTLEDIKQRYLNPGSDNLREVLDFKTLDSIVCTMREMVATVKRANR